MLVKNIIIKRSDKMKEKRKIKGISKVSKRAGLVLAGTILSALPNIANYTDVHATSYEEQDQATDLERYFTCTDPIDENYQITVDSDIYKALAYYEGKSVGYSAEEEGYYVIKDPQENLAVAGGLTLKYQTEILDYLVQERIRK